MSFNALKEKGIPLEKQLRNWHQIVGKPYNKTDVDCYTRTRQILMNGIEVETLDEYKRKLIRDYITENRITQRQITKYIPYFPDKTCRNLIESEVIYRVPQ